MYEMNKLQVFQKKFRKTKELGKQKRSAWYSSVISAFKGFDMIIEYSFVVSEDSFACPKWCQYRQYHSLHRNNELS